MANKRSINPPICRACQSPMEYSGVADTSSRRASSTHRIRRLAQWTCSRGGHQTRYAYTRWFPYQFGFGGWGFTSLEEAVIAAGQMKKNVGIKVYGTPIVLSADRLHYSQRCLKSWYEERERLLKGVPEFLRLY
jgi:RNase P subunit RPR2